MRLKRLTRGALSQWWVWLLVVSGAIAAPWAVFAEDEQIPEPVEIKAVVDIEVKGRVCRLKDTTTETIPGVGQRLILNVYCPSRLSTAFLDTDLVRSRNWAGQPRESHLQPREEV